VGAFNAVLPPLSLGERDGRLARGKRNLHLRKHIFASRPPHKRFDEWSNSGLETKSP
jgi:hypothetical protein